MHINLFLLILIALANILSIAISGFFTKVILQPFDKHLPMLESFYVSLISSVGNFFAPAGAGFGFRAIYLKKRTGLSYSDYVSTLSGNYILVFLESSFLGLVALYFLRSRSGMSYFVPLVLVLAAIFIVSIFLSIFRFPIRPVEDIKNIYLRRTLRLFFRILQGWNHITSHRQLMIKLVGLTFISLVLTSLISWLIIQSLHFHIGLASLVLFGVLGTLSLFINITPANLGIKEAIYLFSSSILGFSTAQILSIALIDRGVLFLVLAGLWAISHKLKSPLQETKLTEQAK